ncbi:MAG: TetR/AcrR family transcriptional regulator [Rhodospirillaceae bacterium]|jgi:AcrR family transcriptional regulator|nr:TetR/AcrR family transcriptional regulator [Rhodospirillaceae bacterium]MBT6140251.1 TetR/AcrR family transcriptional regulator [Rhodospirillaceae bacterium]
MVNILETAEETVAKPTKRDQIVAAACDLFLEQGYEITSMDAIAAEAKVSKRTVYSHFQSKQFLFSEIMGEMCERFGDGTTAELGPSPSPREVLLQAAKFMLVRITEPGIQSLMRTIIKESTQFPEIGQRFWEIGPGHMWVRITEYLREQHRLGVLNVPDPELSSAQFQGLVAGPHFLATLFTGRSRWSAADADRTAERAVEIFLASHQP